MATNPYFSVVDREGVDDGVMALLTNLGITLKHSNAIIGQFNAWYVRYVYRGPVKTIIRPAMA